jgi:NADH-quinone oxidoreductase subunit N
VKAILFYLATYAFMTIGAFAIAGTVGRETAGSESGYDLASWAGLGRRQPWIAMAMTVFLLSMAGIPSTGGFFGKYLIFQAAIESKRYLLAVVGSLNAVVAAAYYLRVVIAMWMKEADEETLAEPVPAMVAAALIVSVVAVFYLGLAPSRVLAIVDGLAHGLV